MATAAANVAFIRAMALARLAELDAVPVDERARMTYSEAGQTYDWNAYRKSLQDTVAWSFDVEQRAGGPFEVRSVVR